MWWTYGFEHENETQQREPRQWRATGHVKGFYLYDDYNHHSNYAATAKCRISTCVVAREGLPNKTICKLMLLDSTWLIQVEFSRLQNLHVQINVNRSQNIHRLNRKPIKTALSRTECICCMRVRSGPHFCLQWNAMSKYKIKQTKLKKKNQK